MTKPFILVFSTDDYQTEFADFETFDEMKKHIVDKNIPLHRIQLSGQLSQVFTFANTIELTNSTKIKSKEIDKQKINS